MLRWKFSDDIKKKLVKVSRSRLVMKCPKHTRYNPAHGGGAIVGNCNSCRETLDAYNAAVNLQQALAEYLHVTEKFETYKPRTKGKGKAEAEVSA